MPNKEFVPHLVHSHDVQIDADYTQWLVELKARYRSAQIKATVKVNADKLLFNWQLGRDLVIKKLKNDGELALLSRCHSICVMSSHMKKDSLQRIFGI